MPIALTTEQREMLHAHAMKVRLLVDFHLDSGRYSFWDGDAAEVFDGVTYIPASDFGSLSEISMGQDLGAEGVTITVSGVKLMEALQDPSDPGALFGTIEDENYVMRRVDIRFAFFDAETDALVLLVRRYAGLIDQIKHIEEASASGRMDSLLVISLESIARRYGRRGGRTRSHDDQQDIWAGDTFFKYTAASIGQKGSLSWGRRPPGATGNNDVRGGLPGTGVGSVRVV